MSARPESHLEKLGRQYNRILRALDREARKDRCRGDIVCGWDWPTLALVRPETYSALRSLQEQAREEVAALKQGGLHVTQTGVRAN